MVDWEYSVVPGQALTMLGCLECRSEYLNPRPSEADLLTYYPSHYHAYHEDHGTVAAPLVAMRARARGARYQAAFANPQAGFLFDVGVGDCRHFDELRQSCNVHCAGVEINAAMAQRGRDRGYDVVNGTLERLPLDGREGRYDIVSMNHVIEHVIDPRLVVEKALRLLRPGGMLVGQLPTNDSWERRLFGRRWGGYHFPRHLQAFSRGGLREMLASVGFVDVRVRTAPHLQTALSLQNSLISLNWRPRMRFGKAPIYSLLLVAVLPFEFVAWLANRGGIINFSARKSAS
jgi:SAM-dependent methyltransferase